METWTQAGARGFLAPFSALPHAFRRELLPLTLACVAIHALLFAGLLALFLWQVWPWVHQVDAWLRPLGEGRAWLASLLAVAGFLVKVLAALALVLAASLLLLVLGRVAAGPLLDLLSERVEELETGVKAPDFSPARLIRGMLLAVADLVPGVALLLVFQGIVWGLGVIPVLGTLAAPCLSVLGASLFLAHEFLGFPLVRRFVPWTGRWSYLFRHKALAVGFGLSCFLLLWVPFLNLLLLPLCAIGGTLCVSRSKDP